MAKPNYPKPGQMGGTLIRRCIGLFREQNIELPLTSHILCATSAGPDSTALGHLMVKYGRKVIRPGEIELLHINHQWRGKESQKDQTQVEELGQSLGIQVHVVVLEPGSTQKKGESWELLARQARKKIFAEWARKKGAHVLTAHQADDLSETLLWRILTGQASTHGAGIWFKQGIELRPFLTTRKQEIEEYLRQEGQPWRRDPSNEDPRFLRAKIRTQLMPLIEEIFPRAHEHLVKAAFEAQNLENRTGIVGMPPLEALISASGSQMRRAHWEQVQRFIQKPSESVSLRALDLPSGWKLIHERPRRGVPERWILERSQQAPKGLKL